MLWTTSRTFLFSLFVGVCASHSIIRAQSASTSVDVGPGTAGAWGNAYGQFQHVDTNSRVGPNGSFARGLAIGAGPNGLAISHSIGVHGSGSGAAHNFNLNIGPGGAHVSGGAVTAQGGQGRVQANGATQSGGWGQSPSGGSNVSGFGHQVHANTHARSTNLGSSPFSRRGSSGFPGRGPFQSRGIARPFSQGWR